MQLEQFLELFNPLPGNCFLEVTTNPNKITTALKTLLESKEGELRVALYGEDQAVYNSLEVEKKQFIQGFANSFRALPRDHDCVIFKEILSLHANPEQLVKTAYTTLANAAHIIIMEKKGSSDIQATLEMLDKHEFRAPNSIDVIEEYDLVMAKKLHMWGNGL